MKLEHRIKRWQIEKTVRSNARRVASAAKDFGQSIKRRRRGKVRRNAGRIATFVAALAGIAVGVRGWRAMRAS